jgi:hypothetical protein
VIAPRIDRDLVFSGLTARAILERLSIEFRDQTGHHRTDICPRCGKRNRRDAVAINTVTGMWCCYVCGATGDIFAMLAGYSGLDARADFPRVLELAADIAGWGRWSTVPNSSASAVSVARPMLGAASSAKPMKPSARPRQSSDLHPSGGGLAEPDGTPTASATCGHAGSTCACSSNMTLSGSRRRVTS